MTTAVDLLDQDGVIISTAAVDDTFWASNAVACAAYAAQKGLGLYVPGGAPQPGEAEVNVSNFGGFQSWVASAYENVVLTPPSSSSSTRTWLTIGAAVAGGLGLLALLVSTRPKT